jgi:hypothetical protein
LIFNYRDNTPPTTPQRVIATAQQAERDQRVLESPEIHRTPHHVRITRLGPLNPPPPFDNIIPPAVPPPNPQFPHLPPNLLQQLAALPPLNPVRQRGRGRGRQAPIVPVPAFALAPAFELAPAAAASTTHYQNLRDDLAQRLAELPSLPQIPQRGRSRRNIPAPAVAPAPLPFEEIAVQYNALPPVCIFFTIIFFF